MAKRRGPPKPQSAIDSFCEAFPDCCFFDMDYSGYYYTWCNFQDNDVVVEEHLDYFCANADLVHPLLAASIFHVDFDMSDRLSILLKCTPRAAIRGEQARRFHFEGMWFAKPSCNEIATSTWTSASTSDFVENLLARMDRCSTELSKWNHKTFGHVSTKIRKLEA